MSHEKLDPALNMTLELFTPSSDSNDSHFQDPTMFLKPDTIVTAILSCWKHLP